MTDEKKLPVKVERNEFKPTPLAGRLEKPTYGYLTASYMRAVFRVLSDAERYRVSVQEGRTELAEAVTRFERAVAKLGRVDDLIESDKREEAIARAEQKARLEEAELKRERAVAERAAFARAEQHRIATARSESREALAKARTASDLATVDERQAAAYLQAVTEKFDALKAAKGGAAEAEALRDYLVLFRELATIKKDLGFEEEKATPTGGRDFVEELLRRMASRRAPLLNRHHTFLRVMATLKHTLFERQRPFPTTLDGWVQVAGNQHQNNALSLEDYETFKNVADHEFDGDAP